jgi:hypothetical protein
MSLNLIFNFAKVMLFYYVCNNLFNFIRSDKTLSALSTQAVPASLLAGTACQDKPDEAQPLVRTTAQTHSSA